MNVTICINREKKDIYPFACTCIKYLFSRHMHKTGHFGCLFRRVAGDQVLNGALVFIVYQFKPLILNHLNLSHLKNLKKL